MSSASVLVSSQAGDNLTPEWFTGTITSRLAVYCHKNRPCVKSLEASQLQPVCNILSDVRTGLSLINRLHLCQMYVSHIWHVADNSSFCTTLKSSISPGFTKFICRTYLMLQRQLSQLNGSKFRLSQVQASYIFCVWLRLVLCCDLVHYHVINFCLLLPHFCLRNLTHTEGWKLWANDVPLCNSDCLTVKVKIKVILRPTVIRPVCPDAKQPSGSRD
jgi:hypothetical protein